MTVREKLYNKSHGYGSMQSAWEEVWNDIPLKIAKCKIVPLVSVSIEQSYCYLDIILIVALVTLFVAHRFNKPTSNEDS